MVKNWNLQFIFGLHICDIELKSILFSLNEIGRSMALVDIS